MESLWPWLVVAASGALHGANPASGWLLAAARAVRAHDRRLALRALLPLALGHVASAGVVAVAVAQHPWMAQSALPALAGALLVSLVLMHAWRHVRGAAACRSPERTGQAGLALWSFAIATLHGAGLMLVPALVPLCLGNAPGRTITASGSMWLALAALAVHMAAMLLVTSGLALAACRAWAPLRALLAGYAERRSARTALGGWPITRLKARLKEASES